MMMAMRGRVESGFVVVVVEIGYVVVESVPVGVESVPMMMDIVSDVGVM